METSAAHQWSEGELRAAFRAGRFGLHYQPQYGARDGRLAGLEGLARLNGPVGGHHPPGVFIPAIERTGLIHELGAALFAQGCADARRWPDLTVAVNVSPVQFRDPGMAGRLIAIAADAGVDPRRIEVEITEGLFFDDPERAEAALRTLRDAGFSIALDDFGTGYSSLAYLLRFPVNKIKIDRSFIADAPDNVNAAAIVHALVALARALGLKIVAEGVENERQRSFLRAAGCHLLQGFLFSGALPPSDVDRLLAERPGMSRQAEPTQLFASLRSA